MSLLWRKCRCSVGKTGSHGDSVGSCVGRTTSLSYLSVADVVYLLKFHAMIVIFFGWFEVATSATHLLVCIEILD
jgi:hypothetical protein